MTAWTPEYRVKVNGYTVTDATLSGLTITSGRQDINSPTPAGYCSLEVINTDGTNYDFTINTAVTIKVKEPALFGIYRRFKALKRTNWYWRFNCP